MINGEHKEKPDQYDEIEREFKRMKWAADQIFLGRTPLDIERECIERRYNDTWF